METALAASSTDAATATAVDKFHTAVAIHNEHVKDLNLKVPLPRFQKTTVTASYVQTLVNNKLKPKNPKIGV